MVLGVLTWVVNLIWLAHDALCTAEVIDAVLLNQIPMAYQLAMDLLFLRALCRFLAHNALIAAQLARMLTFAVAFASKPRIHRAAAI